MRSVLDGGKLRKIAGLPPPRSLEDAIGETIGSFRN